MMRIGILEIVIAFRFTCLGLFLYTCFTIHFTLQSCMTFILLIASIFIPKIIKIIITQPPEEKEKTTKQIMDELYPKIKPSELELKTAGIVSKFVTYDAEVVASLEHFEKIKQNTECVFAKKSKLWGSSSWIHTLSLEENIFRIMPTFLKFTVMCRQKKIDGFVLEIPSKPYAENVKIFGQSVRRILQSLSDQDPEKVHCMDKSYVGKRGWVFEFNYFTFFITTFAPFYPESNSRYAFCSEQSFILFQPELSFALHNLPPDTPETNWDNPQTVRDRIRKAYRDSGREYPLPTKLFHPISFEIVKPLLPDDPIIEWWKNEDIQLPN